MVGSQDPQVVGEQVAVLGRGLVGLSGRVQAERDIRAAIDGAFRDEGAAA